MECAEISRQPKNQEGEYKVKTKLKVQIIKIERI